MSCKGIQKTFLKYILRAWVYLPVFIFYPHTSKAQQLFIKINPVFDSKPLVLDDQNYITANGDTMSIEILKFYLSNFKLISKDNRAPEKNSYHLVDAEDSSSLYFEVNNIPAGIYHQLQFDIGVDSLANVSGAMSGALDPIHGMYWAWNTGYINAKLVGHSRACKTLHQQFDFHIGGYMKPYNSLREVALNLDGLQILSSGSATIVLILDISQWFKAPKTINLANTNDIVIPGKAAMMMADNYMDMFSIKKQP